MGSKRYSTTVITVLAFLLCVALAVLGGPHNGLDDAAINRLVAERLAHPSLAHAALRITESGSAPATLILALLGSTLLVWRGRLFDAGALLAIVLGGRLVVEVLKQLIARPRPDLDLHAVTFQSLSFPSGHAANSMIAFVATALLCAPGRHRRSALTLAIAASLAVGATRPLLGVHWPSDVLAGWIFGLAWAVGWWQILGTRGTGKVSGVSRVHKSGESDDGDEPNLPRR